MKKFKPTTKENLRIELDNVLYHGNNNDIDLNYIDTSLINDMSYLFAYTDFNGKIDKWDVSNVANMSHMFFKAIYFNQPLNKWDVSNVTNMSYMFYKATSFNKTLNSWDTNNVKDMSWMFTHTRIIKKLPLWYINKWYANNKKNHEKI